MDYNDSVYKNDIFTVKIGKQNWTIKNLDVSTFRNGDSIKEVKSNEEWEQRTAEGEPAWCYFNNDPEIGHNFGRLYNWWAVNDSRGLAPIGFHIASDAEWMELIEFLGGMMTAGTAIKNTSGWIKNGNGNNESGFSALPGGKRYIEGRFECYNEGYWWSSTESNKFMACFYLIFFNEGEVIRNEAYKDAGMYVRCIKD